MTREDQHIVLAAARQIPADAALPQLRVVGTRDGTTVCFSVAVSGTSLYETDDAAMAMGFVGGWIAAMKEVVAAELARERH